MTKKMSVFETVETGYYAEVQKNKIINSNDNNNKQKNGGVFKLLKLDAIQKNKNIAPPKCQCL